MATQTKLLDAQIKVQESIAELNKALAKKAEAEALAIEQNSKKL